jgi:predicted ribosomally synthesized peptide with SipW-like signal peptide
MSDGVSGPRMNRRTLLAAMSVVGAAGALTGRGTAAYLTDRETLGTNEATAGAVTLSLDGADTDRTAVGFTVDAYGYANRDEQEICLGLDAASNPGWVWLRSCPRVPAAEDRLEARVSVDGDTVFSGSFGDLLDELSAGVLLTEFADCGATPLTPGPDGTVCLTVAVWAPTALRDDPDAVRALRAASPLGFALDVYAEQSRHVPTPRRPVDGENPSFAFPACPDPEEPPEPSDRGHAISNVSLCFDAPVDPGTITWTVLDPDTGADVTADATDVFRLRVTAPVPIDYAVVKAGSLDSPNGGHRRFEGGTTTITVDSTGGTLLTDAPKNLSRCACEGFSVKLGDWNAGHAAFDEVEAKHCEAAGSTAAATDPEHDRTERPRGPSGPAADDDRGRVPPTGDSR